MVEISLIRDLVAIFGVIAGFSYYVLTVRSTQQNQRQQLETRQAQLFSQFALWSLSGNWLKDYATLNNQEWEDYEDYLEKYGSNINPEAFAIRLRVWFAFEILGKLLKQRLINIDLIHTLGADAVIMQWNKWKDIIMEQRKRHYTPLFMENWEYLVSELLDYREKIGY